MVELSESRDAPVYNGSRKKRFNSVGTAKSNKNVAVKRAGKKVQAFPLIKIKLKWHRNGTKEMRSNYHSNPTSTSTKLILI